MIGFGIVCWGVAICAASAASAETLMSVLGIDYVLLMLSGLTFGLHSCVGLMCRRAFDRCSAGSVLCLVSFEVCCAVSHLRLLPRQRYFAAATIDPRFDAAIIAGAAVLARVVYNARGLEFALGLAALSGAALLRHGIVAPLLQRELWLTSLLAAAATQNCARTCRWVRASNPLASKEGTV